MIFIKDNPPLTYNAIAPYILDGHNFLIVSGNFRNMNVAKELAEYINKDILEKNYKGPRLTLIFNRFFAPHEFIINAAYSKGTNET